MHSKTLGQIAPLRFVTVFFELVAVVSIIWYYGLEQTSGLFQLVPIIVVGFCIHSFLPIKYRPPFFLLLSLIGILRVVPAPNGIAIIGIGLGLILLTHLKIAMTIRVGAVLAVGVALTLIRMGYIETGWDSLESLVIPVVGSLFMFRLIIYLHDVPHEKDRPSIWHRLSYFFMLPNVCFLLFPVVDYQTYKRKYYDDDAESIYRKGIWWMFRGITHLLLYRVVYINLIPSSSEVSGIGGVAHAFVATYFLYLRISGQFHLIAGIMCLFGHNFLETNHLYYLASSASDYWRRINIYWNQFMTKVFYNHAFVWFKKLGVQKAVMLSIAYVFVATWALHAYQWMWLKGEFPVTPKDLIFWGSFMVLAMVGIYFEMKRPRSRKGVNTTWLAAVKHSARVVATFGTISILWSLWSSASTREFGRLIAEAASSTAAEYATFLATVVGIILVYGTIRYIRLRSNLKAFSIPTSTTAKYWWYPATASLVLLTILLSGVETILPEPAAHIVKSASSGRLNRVDEEVLEAGYYETLLEPTDFLKSLWVNNSKRPPGWNTSLAEAGVARRRQDIMMQELIPSTSVQWRDVQFSTNQWGLRDKHYDEIKPDNAFRIALLGSSKEMGWGVGDNSTFEHLVESRVNELLPDSASIEILNFSLYAYTEIQFSKLLEMGTLERFGIDAVVVCSHTLWLEKLAESLYRLTRDSIPLESNFLDQIVLETEFLGKDKFEYDEESFNPLGVEIAEWAYSRMDRIVDSLEIPISIVFVPSINRTTTKLSQLHKLVSPLGIDIIDISNAYGDVDEINLRVAPWDSHPNERAHGLIAEALLPQLTRLLPHSHRIGAFE